MKVGLEARNEEQPLFIFPLSAPKYETSKKEPQKWNITLSVLDLEGPLSMKYF